MLFEPDFDETLLRRSGEKDEEYYSRLREIVDRNRQIGGVSRERIVYALERLERGGRNEVSVVAALLDGYLPNGYSQVQRVHTFSAGASTSHIFCHAGILQHGQKKIDREARDYLLKPLTDLGVIEPAYLDGENKTFVSGYGPPKSPNNCHRLTKEFKSLLFLPEGEFGNALERWADDGGSRARARLQAKAGERMAQTEGSHAELVRVALEFYAPRFVPGYREVYTDLTDGDRITEEQRDTLREAGLESDLSDPSPDALLWNEAEDAFWVIEAVTSDGEVDTTKAAAVERMLARRGRSATVGFTTVYRSWKDAASRQERVKNLAPGSFVWIQSDAGRQLLVEDVSSAQGERKNSASSSGSP